MSIFSVLLVFAMFVVIALVYVFCLSPPARRIGNELFYDPLQESLERGGGNEE